MQQQEAIQLLKYLHDLETPPIEYGDIMDTFKNILRIVSRTSCKFQYKGNRKEHDGEIVSLRM